MNIIKTLTPYFSIDNSLKDATQLEALKNNVVEDNIKELNESLDKIEEGNILSYLDFIYQLNNWHCNPSSWFYFLLIIFKYFLDDSTIADEELEDSDNSEDDKSIGDEDSLEDSEQDDDSPMEDEDKIEDPELNEDSIDDLGNMDRWEPPAPPGHKGAPPMPGAGKKKSEYFR